MTIAPVTLRWGNTRGTHAAHTRLPFPWAPLSSLPEVPDQVRRLKHPTRREDQNGNWKCRRKGNSPIIFHTWFDPGPHSSPLKMGTLGPNM